LPILESSAGPNACGALGTDGYRRNEPSYRRHRRRHIGRHSGTGTGEDGRLRHSGPTADRPTGRTAALHIEKITVRVTESGKTMDVVVLSKHAHRIQVVLGEGVHSVKCELSPTPNRTAFAGKALGREIVYERTPEQVQADLDRLDPALKRSRPR
jgi:hypothetical protein